MELGSVKGSLVGKNFAPPVSRWREQHEDFINTVRNARLSTDAMKKGLPLPPPPPPSINPDYIECPYCNRRFNETAAERHINFCKSNVNRKVVARQTIQSPSTSQAKTPSPTLQVRMASKPTAGTSRAVPASSSSQQTARGPPARTRPSAYSPSTATASQKAAGSPSKGRLTAAAQAVMGIREDDASTSRRHDALRTDGKGQPSAQYSRYGQM
ncbi:zinc finger C2HC domain-containing protein 1A-like [Mobula hypostoma]|uniref:zinc finger C2HC domain-containing protein 1A-like n=1 Tax=Mobula hypostoma TaxID=723540 RepID=UPI002FC300DF